MDYYDSDAYGGRASSSSTASSSETSSRHYSWLPDSVTSAIADVAITVIGIAYKLIMPAVKVAVLAIVILMVAVSSSYFMLTSLSPKSLLQERVYFDFDHTSGRPSATISLVASEKQWYYLNRDANGIVQNDNAHSDNSAATATAGFNNHQYHHQQQQQQYQRYLKSDASYSIDARFVLAKCRRNFDMGKFMVHTTVVDTSGDAIARSSRPIAVPYQSYTTIFLDSMIMFPLRFIGLSAYTETFTVDVNIMNEFKEPPVSIPATEYLELVLSTGDVDVAEVYLSIMPVLRGLTYYVYYYPNTFLVLCSIVLSAVQIMLVALLLVTTWVLRYVSSLFSKDRSIGADADVDAYTDVVDDGDDDDNDDDDNDDDEDEDMGDSLFDDHEMIPSTREPVVDIRPLTPLSLSSLNSINNTNTSHQDNKRRHITDKLISSKHPLGISSGPSYTNMHASMGSSGDNNYNDNDDNNDDNNDGNFIANETWSSFSEDNNDDDDNDDDDNNDGNDNDDDDMTSESSATSSTKRQDIPPSLGFRRRK